MTWDAIVVGSGIGGLVAATQLAAKGARVLVLEQYLIPGGSSGYFDRAGYRFDVGASMIFGFGTEGTTNLLTRALDAVGEAIETIPDPVQIHYHLPDRLDLKVHKDYAAFLHALIQRFPHEAQGIRRFYDRCWAVFNCLNVMDLLSLEEPRYLARVFMQHPFACFGLLRYLPLNVGDIARKYIHDPLLLKFIDMECFCWSTVLADRTPMINAGMVFSDRHYGGVRYPQGGVGQIAEKLVAGLKAKGSDIRYKAKVQEILQRQGRAVGVRLTSGECLYGRRIVSNATRWDTFGKLLKTPTPKAEIKWQQRYQQAPSFLSLHLGVDASAIPTDAECHHILLEDWHQMEQEQGTIFVSIPTLLDPSLAPPDKHIVHTFTPSWMQAWQGLSPSEYRQKKQRDADRLIQRLGAIFPDLPDRVALQVVGSPRTHRRFLGRASGTYGPIPRRKLRGLLGMPFNRTAIKHLYCVGDSSFPGQGLNAVAFSGFACAHRIAADLGL